MSIPTMLLATKRGRRIAILKERINNMTNRRNLGTTLDVTYEDASPAQRKAVKLPKRVTVAEIGNGRTFFNEVSDKLLIKTRSRSNSGQIIATETGTGKSLFFKPNAKATLPIRAALYVKE